MDSSEYHRSRQPKIYSTENMKLTSSASEQNVYFTYVCLVDELLPTPPRDSFFIQDTPSSEIYQQEEPPIQVERTKAVHELVESFKNETSNDKEGHETDSPVSYKTATSGENSESENEDNNFLSCDNPNILKLTKMKWLTEDHDSSPDSSSPSLSPTTSTTSSCSHCNVSRKGLNDKYLSTILQLDKEHNMFGLSSIAIIGSRPSKQKRAKDDDKAVFHQTAIVQVCCGKGCCKHRSKTDLPSSLKCGTCKSCCFDSTCAACPLPCPAPVCADPPRCAPSCTSCPRGACKCGGACPPAGCTPECSKCFGLTIKLNRQPKYEPEPVELTPRSSCVLQKPFAARTCYHTPRCIPPSSCFPYLMPCFWPARPSAPCNNPTRCFHNPPCPAGRSHRKVPLPAQYRCPKHGKKCVGKDTKCTNEICPANIPSMRQELEARFGKGK